MAFDKSTRNSLQRFVSDARSLLTDEFTRQLQQDYGLDPKIGEVADLSKLSHLDDSRLETARVLREILAHYLASELAISGKKSQQNVLERIVREQAFTVLNRLAALRMMEARGLLLESVANGYQSKGFQLYERLAGHALGETGDAYRCYLFSLFDEFARDLKVLFDRYAPQGLLFPREPTLLALLELLNSANIEPLWGEDETIGWIYQYWNSKEERKAMRDASAAPRNSRELAVRNQFFTPRYVVEFLTDNTLGRIWYEMTQGQTRLADECHYLVRRHAEIFLEPGKAAPETPDDETEETLSQEELLKQPIHIPHRPTKDPREIHLLDPACGSMHFGLYAFDLFEVIYEEAWDKDFFPSLKEVYSSKDDYLHDVPRLIIEHNIHGVDIDPRAVQIAGLSLWLRAQKTWMDTPAAKRPRVRRSNIVCAEPMPGSDAMLEDFVQTLDPPLLGQLVNNVFEKMRLAGEAGTLLKIEQEIRTAIEDAREQWVKLQRQQPDLFSTEEINKIVVQPEFKTYEQSIYALQSHGERGTANFFDTAEERIYAALHKYAESAEADNYQRRLFAEDVAHGFAFIDLCRKRYDAVVMNPPFGFPTENVFEYLKKNYLDTYVDLYAAFALRGRSQAPEGRVGIISSRSFLTSKKLARWRQNQLNHDIDILLDLGRGVMDDALVDSCAYVVSAQPVDESFVAMDARGTANKTQIVSQVITGKGNVSFIPVKRRSIRELPGERLLYFLNDRVQQLLKESMSLEPTIATVRGGLRTFEDFRFLRTYWEVPTTTIGKKLKWNVYAKGGEYSNYFSNIHLVINRAFNGAELAAKNQLVNGQVAQSRQGSSYYFLPGCQYSMRSSKGFSCRAIPRDCVMSHNAPMIIPQSLYSPEYLLGWVSSRLIRSMIEMQSVADDYIPGSIKLLPWIDPSEPTREEVEQIGRKLIYLHRACYSGDETTRIFSPNFSGRSASIEALGSNLRTEFSNTAEEIIAHQQSLGEIIDDVYQVDSRTFAPDILERDIEVEVPETNLCDDSISSNILSFSIGAVFGRWDIRLASGEHRPLELPDPFDPLPICPPGMLQNADGLPAAPADIPDEYPLRITWPGILVDDDGHPEDIVARVRDSLSVIWNDRASTIEQQACEILGVRTLRDYFVEKKSGGQFFEDHIKRYSMSRRKAPIYWPLSTKSGSYTLWVFYHRLNDQILYVCVNDFIQPKLRQVTDNFESLRKKSDRTSKQEKELSMVYDMKAELEEFRDELLGVAKHWKPNLNDGVQITAAPLWPLFRRKPWQKVLRDTWNKLEKGDYDWAHLAMSYWPDRVREKCKMDKSLAIAHALEDVYQVPSG